MSDSPNLKILENISLENKLENLSEIFYELIKKLQIYLKLKPLINSFKVFLKESGHIEKTREVPFFEIGAERSFEKESLILKIYPNYKKFLSIIMLREAYNCFIPPILRKKKSIQILINQIIQNDFGKSKLVDDWNSFINERIINYDVLSANLDKLEKFIKLKSTENIQSSIQFIFEYLRRNVLIIQEIKMEDFYFNIFKEYTSKISQSMNDEDIIEAIYLLIKIFYEKQTYNYLIEYEKYFKEYKEIFHTELSLSKFIKNITWINKFSYISPSYQINWRAIEATNIICNLKFNPLLKKGNIDKILNRIPFFLNPKYYKNGFALEISGYFTIPMKYLNDLLGFIKKLYQNGYITNKECYIFQSFSNCLNLNYFCESKKNQKKLINPNHKNYKNKYEIEFKLNYSPSKQIKQLSMFDWVILERISFVSVTGMTFERRSETLNYLKSDVINEILSQRALIEQLKKNLNIFKEFQQKKSKILNFLEMNQKYGFFYIRHILNSLLTSLNIIKEILKQNSHITNISQLYEFITKNGLSQSIEENLILNNKIINKILFREIIPLYFKSKKEFKNEIDNYSVIIDFFKSCDDLKIFNLKVMKEIIENQEISLNIFEKKDKKLKESYEKYQEFRITNQEIDRVLEQFLSHNPPIIKPLLINTILTSTFSKYYTTMIINDNPQTQKILEKLRPFFPRSLEILTEDLFLKKKLKIIEYYLPSLKELDLFTSILFNNLNKDIIKIKRFLSSGVMQFRSLKNFYDFDKKDFFYTQDLFSHYFLFIKNIFGQLPKPLSEVQNIQQNIFWSKEKDISHLIKSVEARIRGEHVDLSVNKLNDLVEFHNKLEENLLDLSEFKESQEKFFFKNYIKSINFIPSFQKIGISQYFLYFYPTDIDQIDFKLLMNNSFQSISYPAQIDISNSFLCQFIFPFRNPGISPYLNWLTKSKKIVREYCLFFVKKVYQILHFNYNLSSDGWDLDPNRFKMYFQNILFNPDYKVQIPDMKEFNIGDLNVSDYFGPDSPEFKALSQIYNRQSLDIKTYLTRRYFKIIGNITELINKGLIHPYISVKNLDLIEEITIILPNVKQELNEKIIKIFSFFNVGFIYEVEGAYFIHGFDEVIKYENGLMIKLRLPDCQLDEFERLFDLIFEYLEIDHYLVLNDLVDGKNLIKSTFKDLKFLETYNPLINLIWNDKDKKWQNHKLFNENFDPVYPDLLYGKEKYNL